MQLARYAVDRDDDHSGTLEATFEHEGQEYTIECEYVERTTRPSAHTPFPSVGEDADMYAWPTEAVPEDLVFTVESQEDLNEALREFGLRPTRIGGIVFMDEPYHKADRAESPFIDRRVEDEPPAETE